jgi:hypothetical protein
MHDLWHDWVAVARKAGRMPTIRQYEKFSRYSVRPLKDRFRAWERIPSALLEYGNAKGLWTGWEDVKELIGRKVNKWTSGQTYTVGSPTLPGSPDIAVIGKAKPATESLRNGESRKDWQHSGLDGLGGRAEARREEILRAMGAAIPEVLNSELLYGEPLSLGPMATAPVNEMGVVYLFGTLARELGFVVLKMQPGFPDCEALRRLESGKWQRVRIEFEFESRNFVWHAHDMTGCELIVCWEDNWEDCPLEVMELKRAFSTQQSAFSPEKQPLVLSL